MFILCLILPGSDSRTVEEKKAFRVRKRKEIEDERMKKKEHLDLYYRADYEFITEINNVSNVNIFVLIYTKFDME